MTSLNYNYKINYIVILLSVLSIIYILFTNTYFSVENSFIYGAADGESYLKIAEASPYISNQDIQPIHSERFIISYLIGFLAKIFEIEIYLLFIPAVHLLFIVTIRGYPCLPLAFDHLGGNFP